MRNRLFALLLFVLLFIGIGEMVKPQNGFSKIEKRNLDKITDFNMYNQSLENVLKDQFYFRDKIIKTYFKNKIALNDVPYFFLNKISDSNIEYIYLNSNVIAINNDFLINDILAYDEEKLETCKSKAYNINEVDLRYPNIKTYVYFPTKLEEVLDFDDNYGKSYREAFIQQLNSNISYCELKVNGIDEASNYFYKTDFHWNGNGAYQAYMDIINMINKDYDIGSPKDMADINVYDYNWTGNIASEIGGNWKPDKIIDIQVNGIGNYKYFVDGIEYDYGKEKESYQLYGNNTMYSDYDYFYGNNYYEKRFEFYDEAKPNILIFCDSLSNVNQEWLASHFNTTIYIDLRANDGSFNLDEYIKKYNINIILVSQIYSNLYFNGYMFIPIE